MYEFDVVILSWNRASLTKETVENILDQEKVSIRIWIIDQGSSPGDLEILHKLEDNYSNISLYEAGENLGVPRGRNLGMSLGNAKYIVCIDNDAIFERTNALEMIAKRFEHSPQLAVIGLRNKNYFTGQDDTLWWIYPKAQLAVKDQEFYTTRFPGGGHAIRRSVFEKVGGYDEKLFFYWEEVDFSNKVINSGFQILYTPDIAFLHKVSPEARIHWKNGRFFFVTRNALYIHFKYYKDPIGTVILACGYLVKGFFNLMPGQALLGVISAVKMCYQAWPEIRMDKYTLNENARAYINQYEKRYRGNLWMRMRREVFVKLSRQG